MTIGLDPLRAPEPIPEERLKLLEDAAKIIRRSTSRKVSLAPNELLELTRVYKRYHRAEGDAT